MRHFGWRDQWRKNQDMDKWRGGCVGTYGGQMGKTVKERNVG